MRALRASRIRPSKQVSVCVRVNGESRCCGAVTGGRKRDRGQVTPHERHSSALLIDTVKPNHSIPRDEKQCHLALMARDSWVEPFTAMSLKLLQYVKKDCCGCRVSFQEGNSYVDM